MGVPEDCANICINALRDGFQARAFKKHHLHFIIPDILDTPQCYIDKLYWGDFAKAIIAHNKGLSEDAERHPTGFREWGSDDIDDAAREQMRRACGIPMAYAAALMPDAHIGYGLPIGGVLATEGYVIPYAVGVDIACRMRITIIDKAPETLETQFDKYRLALERGTLFGLGTKWQNNKQHPVMDANWKITPITGSVKDKAHDQLGTSGSGNHFVEFGAFDVTRELGARSLGIEPGKYVALLSHSGSRGPGSNVCNYYSKIARDRLPKRYEDFRFLAWLGLDTEAGKEYWVAMHLMGKYAAANHEIIHRDVLRLLGCDKLTAVENYHNFAWEEELDGKKVVVHRKGATPASVGKLGVIPGSMGDPCFIVRGLGNPDSIFSASHGAGRKMSRKEAKRQMGWGVWRDELKKRGVTLLSGGIDEVPGVYKSITDVMAAQTDLVDIVARFDPRIVKMCGDNSKAED
jgi:tRNA-splicing ligase RtcB